MDWMEPTYFNTGVVSQKMEEFIGKINSVNKLRKMKDGVVLIQPDDVFIHRYEKEEPKSISANEYLEFIIKMIDMLSDYDDPDRIWKLIKKITVLEINADAQVVLGKLRRKKKDSFTKAVCNYLEQYIEE